MVRSRAPSDIERATMKKAAVSTAPSWAQGDPLTWNTRLDDGYFGYNGSASSSRTLISKRSPSSAPPLPCIPSSAAGPSAAGPSAAPAWSVFATMSNASTVSEQLAAKHFELSILAAKAESAHTHSHLRRYPQKLAEVFMPNRVDTDSVDGCTCNCLRHLSKSGVFSSTRSNRRSQKHSLESMRGYPTGKRVASSDPQPLTAWDEYDPKDLLLQARRQAMGTNTAFNLETLKMFLNSPLFSNFLKILTVMVAVSLFAIALDTIIILDKDLVLQGEADTPLSNANASLYITVILSVLTIAYSCFTIFLELRRPPEGLDTSNSKPLFVIISEIIASIVWAQVLSVTIYIYSWAFGCTEAGGRQLNQLWNQEGVVESLLTSRRHLDVVEKMCRREGAMVGLELLLVLLLIFNFYTHLAQNFQFIRAVSR